MTPLSVVLTYFPTLLLLLSAASVVYLCAHPGIAAIALLLFILYGLPVLTYRLHQWRYPIQEGISYLQADVYSPWWGSHQIQVIYIAFPALETALRLIPGMFSLWLRLWGAKVGRQVYWTPKLEIADRGLVDIGDRVVFGHGIGIYSHIIKPRRQDLMLYVKPVRIGNDVFLGAGSHFAPGVIIMDGTYLPVATHLYPNQTANPDSV